MYEERENISATHTHLPTSMIDDSSVIELDTVNDIVMTNMQQQKSD